jgi:uncharacterized protein (TIGR02453 family)
MRGKSRGASEPDVARGSLTTAGHHILRRNKEFPGIPSAGLEFLRQLQKHNNRPWFQARKHQYEELVKGPMQDLILRIGEAFREFAPEMSADPRTSFYRIYRDVRFSADKSPYKTQAAAGFAVRGLPKNSAPGLYFHISPEEVLIGGGIYMPDPVLLRAVREQIAAHPQEFLAIVEGKEFRRAFGEMEGERLKTVPKGFAEQHPAAKYLRYKQYLFGEVHPPEMATSRRLLPAILRCFEKGMPLIRFLKEPAARALTRSSLD